MSFYDISYLEIWWSLYPVEWNHLCNFITSHNEEQFCEIIKFGQEEMLFKDIFI